MSSQLRILNKEISALKLTLIKSELKIYDIYLKDLDLQQWFQYFTSLVFLPIKYISFGLEYIKSIKPIIST